jgi:hypothetical protein
LSDNDLKELKEYLNNSPYALKSTVWTEEGSNEGYYGISLKINENIPKNIASSTGKKIYKRENNTNMLLGTWNSIAKAAESEGMCAAKMSRYVKNKTIANNSYYSTV